ncbi:MAG: putative maltokinase, partial [Pseudomonadota bacterium]
RNGGFSRANPQQLYLPPVMDPVYGYQAVNVEAQEHDPSSLLNWMRRIIRVREQHPAFGRGTMTFLYPRNRKIIAYVREHEGETMLCVANLSRSAQAVELDLAAYRTRVPVELSGNTPVPPIGDLPYMLTLPSYAFFWFLLAGPEEAPNWHEPLPEMLPDFLTLTSPNGRIDGALKGREKVQLEEVTLPQFLPLQRWFAAKDERIEDVTITHLATLDEAGYYALAKMDVTLPSGTQTYLSPFSIRWGEENIRSGAPKLSYTLAKVRHGPRLGALIDGTFDEVLGAELIALMREGAVRGGETHSVSFLGTDALKDIGELDAPRPLGVEQSNVSIVFGEQVILKIYRRVREGHQPDVEIARHLTDVARFDNTPALLGTIELATDGGEAPAVLAAAFDFVPNQGDAWTAVLDALVRHMEGSDLFEMEMADEAQEPVLAFPLGIGELAGERTAQMHLALAVDGGDPAFAPEPITADDLSNWAEDAIKEADTVLARLRGRLADLSEDAKPDAEAVLGAREQIAARYRAVADAAPSGHKTRIHGDYHLGQVLVAQSDFVIIDFEGEPTRPLDERRAKSAPLRDAAGMLRSFDYAAAMALARWRDTHDTNAEEARAKALEWRDTTRRDFLASYLETMGEAAPEACLTGALLDLFTLHKAIYEIGYELANRPTWVRIPLAGVMDVLADPRGVSAWADAPIADALLNKEPPHE